MLRGIGRPKGQRRLWIATLFLALVGGDRARGLRRQWWHHDDEFDDHRTKANRPKRRKAASRRLPHSPPKNSSNRPATTGSPTAAERPTTASRRLSEINTENVKELKGEWMTKIGANATAAKFSAEGQALEYEGTIYISDGADDVFAIDAGNGRIPLDLRTAPAARPARRSRLLWLGQPRRRDRRRHGLRLAAERRPGRARPGDRQSRMVRPNVVKPGQGFSITSAPLYYNGKVYVGGSGGEYGVRGRLTALDAENRQSTTGTSGPRRRRRKPVATPGRSNGSYKTGGASIWNTPTVNPKTGMLFFSTSNASPWVGRRARRRKPLHRVDRRPRRRNRQIPLPLPGGPPRPLGLRRSEPDRPDDRDDERRRSRSGGRAGEDRLGLRRRSGKLQAGLPDPRGQGPAGSEPEDLADPAGADDGTVQPDRSDAGSGRKSRRSASPPEAEAEDRRHRKCSPR